MDEKQIKEIESLFGSPVAIPGEFVHWMVDQFALAIPSIPISQLFGARTVERMFDIETDSVTVSGGTETEIYSVAIPAKSIAQNGRLRVVMPITIADAAAAASANARIKLNGNTVLTQPVLAAFVAADPEDLGVTIWNHGQYQRQTIESFWRYTRFTAFTTVDLSADATLSITFQFTGGDANDILVRKAAFATLYNPSDA